MKEITYSRLATALFVVSIGINTNASSIEIHSDSYYKKMIHMKKTDGVVNLQASIPSANTYAVGATHQGFGEITVIDSEVWLDYGKDHLTRLQEGKPIIPLTWNYTHEK